MTPLWALYAVGLGLIFALAAEAVKQVFRLAGRARRGVWVASLCVAGECSVSALLPAATNPHAPAAVERSTLVAPESPVTEAPGSVEIYVHTARAHELLQSLQRPFTYLWALGSSAVIVFLVVAVARSGSALGRLEKRGVLRYKGARFCGDRTRRCRRSEPEGGRPMLGSASELAATGEARARAEARSCSRPLARGFAGGGAYESNLRPQLVSSFLFLHANMRPDWKSLATGVSFFLAGCADGAGDPIDGTWRAEQDQRGDTLIVRTLSGGVWGDTMRLVPELAIGELDGSPELVFGWVSALDLDAEGNLLVLDSQAREVRVFSGTGEHLRTFGGAGDGPGEFRGPDHLRVLSDGTIVVRDQRAARFSVLTASGEYSGGWPRATGYATNQPFFLDGEGRVVNPSLPGRLVVYGLDGAIHDTIAVPSLGYDPPGLTVTSGSGSASYSIPFMPREVWTMTRDGRVVIGVGRSYAIERREPDGTVLRIERVAEPVPVAPGEAAHERERITTLIRRSNDPGWSWRGPDVPSTKPMFVTIESGIDGTTWVFREGRSVEEPNPDWDPAAPQTGFQTRWKSSIFADVFDESGRYLGAVEVPESVSWAYPAPILARDGVWAPSLHPAGYPQVVRFRLEAARPVR